MRCCSGEAEEDVLGLWYVLHEMFALVCSYREFALDVGDLSSVCHSLRMSNGRCVVGLPRCQINLICQKDCAIASARTYSRSRDIVFSPKQESTIVGPRFRRNHRNPSFEHNNPCIIQTTYEPTIHAISTTSIPSDANALVHRHQPNPSQRLLHYFQHG